MPIQPVNYNSYKRIPDDEDVTPVGDNLSVDYAKRRTSNRVVVGFLAIVIVLPIFLFFAFSSNSRDRRVIVLQTSRQNPIMTEISSADRKIFSPYSGAIRFGNVDCMDIDCAQDSSFLLLNSSRVFQRVIGFGGAFTESAATIFYKLPKKVQQQVLDLYFGEDGHKFSLGRIHINSCDFSLQSYSFDDVKGDYDLDYFDNEVTHDTVEIIPFILSAMETSKLPIRLVASPWSPPSWMKEKVNNNQTMTGSATPNGLIDDPKIKLTWARYISRFVSSYKYKGVDIWAITPQNEPEFAAPWEACAYNASFERRFIQDYLGPIIRTEHPELLILAFDHNKDHLHEWTKEMMMDENIRKYVDGMAFHWYGGMDRNTDGTYGYENVAEAHRLLDGKVLLSTEGCNCPGVSWNDWIRAERLGHDIIFDLNNFAQGWIDWNLLLNFEGGPNHQGNLCDASIIALPDFSNIHIQPKFHYFGHFSKFITPDSIRVETNIVGNFGYAAIDPTIQPALEVGFFPCEKSSRQMWVLDNQMRLMQSSVSEYTNTSMELCLGYGDSNRDFLRVLDCNVSADSLIRPVLRSSSKVVDLNTGLCLHVDGPAALYGGLLQLKSCDVVSMTTKMVFELSQHNELKSTVDGYCLTAGWPFLTSTAAVTPKKETVVVVMNEASVSTNLILSDVNVKNSFSMRLEPRSIVTIQY